MTRSTAPTLPVPPGRPCGDLFCGDAAEPGSSRCSRHNPMPPPAPIPRELRP